MHKVRNMLLVVLVLSAGLVLQSGLASAVESLPSDPTGYVTAPRPAVGPNTGDPDVGQTIPHPTTTKSYGWLQPVDREGEDTSWTVLRLWISRIWAALYLKVGI